MAKHLPCQTRLWLQAPNELDGNIALRQCCGRLFCHTFAFHQAVFVLISTKNVIFIVAALALLPPEFVIFLARSNDSAGDYS